LWQQIVELPERTDDVGMRPKTKPGMWRLIDGLAQGRIGTMGLPLYPLKNLPRTLLDIGGALAWRCRGKLPNDGLERHRLRPEVFDDAGISRVCRIDACVRHPAIIRPRPATPKAT
jgi:hypothetical protein